MADNHQFRWEEPAPPRQRTFADYGEDMEKVKKRPGAWARLRVFTTHSGAYSARLTLRKRYPDPRWEFVNRRLREGKYYGVYACWHPHPAQVAAEESRNGKVVVEA